MNKPKVVDVSVSSRMQQQRERNTQPEVRLRQALWRRGYRYRVHYRALRGLRREVDVAFPKVKLAVFVDGCFWHGCREHRNVPGRNSEWWQAKLESNRVRDADTDDRLRADGWTVIRIWEHEPLQAAVERITATHAELRDARGRRGLPPAGRPPTKSQA